MFYVKQIVEAAVADIYCKYWWEIKQLSLFWCHIDCSLAWGNLFFYSRRLKMFMCEEELLFLLLCIRLHADAFILLKKWLTTAWCLICVLLSQLHSNWKWNKNIPSSLITFSLQLFVEFEPWRIKQDPCLWDLVGKEKWRAHEHSDNTELQ